MTEKGNDELLAEIADADIIDEGAEVEAYDHDVEEERVVEMAPAEDEPGKAYPDPDETPDGTPPEFDPLPPQEADHGA